MANNLSTATLGRTGLEVTRLGFGAMELRNMSPERRLTEDQASAILNGVLDAGINYFDTSIDYGESEEIIGRHVSHRRSEFYLASKCGCAATPEAFERGDHVYTRENIVAGVDQSLARMETDYLDAVQFHGSPSRAAIEEEDAIATLLDLKQEGKIRFFGSSSTLPDLADHVAMGVFDLFQIPYSGFNREHEDWITKSAEAGIGTVIRGGVAKGEREAGSRGAERYQTFEDAGLDELREEGESRTAFMLRFTLSHPDLHTTIVGTQNPDHLKENVAAAKRGALSAEVYAEAKRRLAKAGQMPAPE